MKSRILLQRAYSAKGRQSRPKRWSIAAQDAQAALNALREVQEEYSDWYENLPDNLQQSPVGEKLEEVVNIDIEGALSIIEEAADADLPRGFGRDIEVPTW